MLVGCGTPISTKFVKVVNVASQPILSLGGLGEFDEFGAYPASMIKDGQRILATMLVGHVASLCHSMLQ